MQLGSLMKLFPALIFSILLLTAKGIDSGCQDWDLGETGSVCCRSCRPGNHLVTMCGPKPEKLCTPCQPNSYTDKPRSLACSRCTQCIDPQVELKACNASADTVCGCKPGFRCGDKKCEFCVDECGIGDEPTSTRSCRKCPEGMFNDKIHSSCKHMSTSCPKGETRIAEGNAFSDIKCGRSERMPNTPSVHFTQFNTVEPLPVEKKTKDQSTEQLAVGIICGTSAFAVIIIIIIVSLLLTSRRTKKSKIKAQTKDRVFTVMMVDREEVCSFHQPEQEEGGSSESLSTQCSESKLIV